MSPLMVAHVAAGVIGIVSGAAALLAPKGRCLHRGFGSIFFLAMPTAAVSGAYLGIVMQRGALLVGGILTCYLVATAWLTVLREPGRIGWFERIAPVAALAGASVALSFGFSAVHSPHGQFQGVPAVGYFGPAFVGVLAATLDVKVIRKGGVSGSDRIARHLWRMCVALFEATSAFFIGQQKVMPHWMHGSPVLILLGVAPLLAMAYWLVRLRLPAPRHSFGNIAK
jgi:uncharacterized membrane protein